MPVFVLMQYIQHVTPLMLNSVTVREAIQAIRWQNLYPQPQCSFHICHALPIAGTFISLRDEQIQLVAHRGYWTAGAWREFLQRYWR